MSAKTWGQEYCPVPVEAKHWTDKQCFEHTLRKYKGVTKPILKKHKLRKEGSFLIPITANVDIPSDVPKDQRFDFNEKNCALCTKYRNDKLNKQCGRCPLSLIDKECGNYDAPYELFCEDDTTAPMINTMKKMIKQCDKNGAWDL